MRTTNRSNLPEAFLRFDEKNQHSREGSDFSATELIDSPRIAKLRQQYEDQIEEDISDRIMSILGTAVHVVLEQGAPEHCKVEERLHMNVNGVEISGQIDLQTPVNGGVLLSDYKTCGAFAIQFNPHGKPEWIRQLNVYAALAENNGRIVTGLEVIAIVRDWNATSAERVESYPDHPIVRVPIKLWNAQERDAYILDRIDAHTSEELPECTYEERWARPTQYAVHEFTKSGTTKKRATRLLDSMVSANEYIMNKNIRGEIHVRPGKNVRCESYCPVSNHCNQWKEIQEKDNE